MNQPTFIFKIKQKPKHHKKITIKQLFQFKKKREIEESLRCDEIDSKFFYDDKGVQKYKSDNFVVPDSVVSKGCAYITDLNARNVSDLFELDVDVNDKKSGCKVESINLRKGGKRGENKNKRKMGEIKDSGFIEQKNDKFKNSSNESVNNNFNESVKDRVGVRIYSDENVQIKNKKENLEQKLAIINIAEEKIPKENILENGSISKINMKKRKYNTVRQLTAISKEKEENDFLSKTSPLKYFMYLNDKESNQDKINKILKLSLAYLSRQEESLKDVNLSVEINDKIEEKLREVETDIEKYSNEIQKWTDTGEQFYRHILKEECSYEIGEQLPITCIEKVDYKDKIARYSSRIDKLSMMMNKYLEIVKSGCEDVYKKMFAMVKDSDLDPLMVLKMLSKLKRIDE